MDVCDLLAVMQAVNDCAFSIYLNFVAICHTMAWWCLGKPVIIGIALSFIMWQMVHLNSNITGIDPPSPFKLKKLRDRTSPTFHLDYTFAVIIGLLTTFSLLVRELIF